MSEDELRLDAVVLELATDYARCRGRVVTTRGFWARCTDQGVRLSMPQARHGLVTLERMGLLRPMGYGRWHNLLGRW